MMQRAPLAFCAAVTSLALPCPAEAQAAAESAIILSGTGQAQGRAARSLGAAVSQSMNRASAAIQPRQNGTGHAASSRTGGSPHASYAIPAGVDPLAGTDAPTYQLGNGASIRVSGRLQQAPSTTCVKDCPPNQVP